MSLHRLPLHQRHFPFAALSFPPFRVPASDAPSFRPGASPPNSLAQLHGSSWFLSAGEEQLGTNWFQRIGLRSAGTSSSGLKGADGVRVELAETGGREVRSRRTVQSGSSRRKYTKGSRVEVAVTGMGKKPPPRWPKQLPLRNAMANPSSTISFVQILGTGMDTGDTAPCVLLFFDQRRFIFNAGEGLQRFCIEHKVKLSKIDHIFLTRVGSETAGGLPGLLLTLAGMGDAGMAVNIWGPSELKYLVDAMRTFVPGASVVHTHSFGFPVGSSEGTGAQSEVLLEDDVVKITAVLLRPQTSSINEETGSKKETKRPRVQQTDGDSLSSSEGRDVSVYICELPEVKGRFDIEKARKFFNRAGPHYGLLQAGQSVMSHDGVTMVYPEDVMDPPSPGPIFILVDCPTAAYIPALLSNPVMCSLQEQNLGIPTKQVTLIVHTGPVSVTGLPQYQSWLTRFAGAQHVMAGHGLLNMSQPVLKASARVVSRLNCICPHVFPVSGLQSSEPEGQIMDKDKRSRSDRICVAENLLKFHLRPLSNLGLDFSAVPEPFSMNEIQEKLLIDIPELPEFIKKLSNLWNPTSSNAIIANSSVGKYEDMKYYCEEPWLMETIPPTRRRPADVAAACSSDGVRGYIERQASEIQAAESGSESLTEGSKDLDDIPLCLKGVTREEMEMVFLGTGSSQPSKYRNVSAIYVHLFEKGGIMLDCGEGTYAQLQRRYGARTDDVLADLKLVWISHIHADHHTGLVRLLCVRRTILRDRGAFVPVLVVGPKQLKRFLDAYNQLEDLGMEFLDCSQTTYDADDSADIEQGNQLIAAKEDKSESPLSGSAKLGGSVEDITAVSTTGTTSGIGLVRKSSLNSKTLPKKGQMLNYWLLPGANLLEGIDWSGRDKLKQALSSLGLARLNSVPVVHCPNAFGVVLESKARIEPSGFRRPGWKVVYSGDTRPCEDLVDASEAATVLIHEATFDDSMPEEAYAKKHSLTKEAIETGVSAGVYRTILTHFSQRYPKIPVFDDSYTSRTCIAFDMMTVNLADLPLLPSLLPALKLLFKDDLASTEDDKDGVGDKHEAVNL